MGHRHSKEVNLHLYKKKQQLRSLENKRDIKKRNFILKKNICYSPIKVITYKKDLDDYLNNEECFVLLHTTIHYDISGIFIHIFSPNYSFTHSIVLFLLLFGKTSAPPTGGAEVFLNYSLVNCVVIIAFARVVVVNWRKISGKSTPRGTYLKEYFILRNV